MLIFIAIERTCDAVHKDYDYAFMPVKYPGVPDMSMHVIDNRPFYVDDIKIIPLTVMHYKLPVTAFRIGNFAYVTDANFISEENKKKLKGVEYLIINALKERASYISFFIGSGFGGYSGITS